MEARTQTSNNKAGPNTRSKNNIKEIPAEVPTPKASSSSVISTSKTNDSSFSLIAAKIDALERIFTTKIEEMKSEFLNHITVLEEKLLAHIAEKTALVEQGVQQTREIVADLEMRIDSLERGVHSRDLIVYGVPESGNENLNKIYTNLCGSLDIENPPTPLRVFRTRGRSDSTVSTTIIVKFHDTYDRNTILKAAAGRGKTSPLCLRDVGFPSDAKVSIYESLTKTNYGIFREATRLKHRKLLQSVFTRQGQVFIRRKVDDPAEKITCIDGLTTGRHNNQR